MSTIVCDRRRRRGGTEGVPLLGQEGWTRHQENAAKPPLKARPGWSVRRKRRRAGLTTPSAPLRSLRVFFLMAQPPLLSQEGNTLALTIFVDLEKLFQKSSTLLLQPLFPVIFLQSPYIQALSLKCADSVDRGGGAGDRGDAWDVMMNGGAADRLLIEE